MISINTFSSLRDLIKNIKGVISKKKSLRTDSFSLDVLSQSKLRYLFF